MRLVSVLSLVLFLNMLSGCASEGAKTDEAKGKNAGTVPGGYSSMAVDDADVVKAAEFAVSEQSKSGAELKLKSVKSAASQVVAGTNYQMTLTVDEGGVEKDAEVVVYRDLKDVMSVTSWTLNPAE